MALGLGQTIREFSRINESGQLVREFVDGMSAQQSTLQSKDVLAMKRLSWLSSFLVLAFILAGCAPEQAVQLTSPAAAPASTGMASPIPTDSLLTAAAPQLPEGSYIAMAGVDSGSLFLVDLGTGLHRKLEIPGETGVSIYGWSQDGCTLLVGTETQRMIRVDLDGHIREEISRLDGLDAGGSLMSTSMPLSPDEKWLAFLSGTGNQEYATYEFQDLVIVAAQDQASQVRRLTHSGIVNDYSWKPGADRIAYNDVDAQGIQQVFVSSPDGSERSQLTRFAKAGVVVRFLTWSPAGEKLAVLLFEEATDTSYLAVIDTSSDNKLMPIHSMVKVQEYWWSAEDVIAARAYEAAENSNANDHGRLTWYSASTGEKLGELDPTALPDGSFGLPGPLALPNRAGFFSDHAFYIYDLSSARLEKAFDQFVDLRYWIPAPKAFDAQQCSAHK